MDQPAPPAAAAGQYEFSEAENAIFTGLARAMRLVGTMALALGALMAAGFFALMAYRRIGQGSLALIQGMVMIVMGLWNREVCASIDKIVTSSGSDIAHLMQAMEKLRLIYNLTQTLLLATILLAGLSFFIGLS